MFHQLLPDRTNQPTTFAQESWTSFIQFLFLFVVSYNLLNCIFWKLLYKHSVTANDFITRMLDKGYTVVSWVVTFLGVFSRKDVSRMVIFPDGTFPGKTVREW